MNFYWACAGSFVFFILIGVLGGSMLHLEGPRWYFFMGLMAALGLSSFGPVLLLPKKSPRTPQRRQAVRVPLTPASNETDPLIRDANARLAQSKAGAGIANLPDDLRDRRPRHRQNQHHPAIRHRARILAGQVYQDNAITPTRTANIFYARGTVFVEAGGAVLGTPQAWSRLVAKLQPGKLKSLGGGQAPRGVLLCFDLETFTRQGAAESIANAARYLQARLGEISQILGVSFPVYVLFTRADRLPYFAEFVRNLKQRRSRSGSRCNPTHAPRQRLRRLRRRRKPAPHRSLHPTLPHLLRSTPAPAPARNRRRKTPAVLRIPPRIPQTPQRARAVPSRHRTPQPTPRQPLPARLLFLRCPPRDDDRSSRLPASDPGRASRSQRSYRHVPRRRRSPTPRPASPSHARRRIAKSSPVALPRPPVQRRNPNRRVRPQSQRLQHQNQHAETRPLRHRRWPVSALLDLIDRVLLRQPFPGSSKPWTPPAASPESRRSRTPYPPKTPSAN